MGTIGVGITLVLFMKVIEIRGLCHEDCGSSLTSKRVITKTCEECYEKLWLLSVGATFGRELKVGWLSVSEHLALVLWVLVLE